MKSWLAIALLIGFVSLAVFGALGMIGHGQQHGGCIAAAAMATDCPGQESPLASATFHMKALASFMTAVFGDVVGLAIVLIALAFALLGDLLRDRPRLALALSPQGLCLAESTVGEKRQLHSWLALFEKRDPDLS